jgi:hypothetical protein
MAATTQEPQLNGGDHNTDPLPASAEKSHAQLNGSTEKQQQQNENGADAPSAKDAEKEAHEQDDKKEGEDKSKDKDGNDGKEAKQPEGGFDSTPIPHAPPGYTLKITFHRASNLPMADINSLSSDPFIVAQMHTSLPTRHREDPPLTFRTKTIRRDTDPEWNTSWTVANVPASGFRLKCRLYDEDPADHDDRLGNATVIVPSLSENWGGINNQSYKIKKRMGSKRAYLLRAMAVCIKRTKHMDGHLFLSIEMLGRTQTREGGLCYTQGPMWWTRHYSPLLGRIAGRKEPGEDTDGKQSNKKAESYKYVQTQLCIRPQVRAVLTICLNQLPSQSVPAPRAAST